MVNEKEFSSMTSFQGNGHVVDPAARGQRPLMAAHEQDPEQALACYQAIYDRAGDYISVGLYAGNALDLKMPFERGQFSYIRAGFYEEWQPRGAIEASRVDTLAQCYVGQQYWFKRSFQAANTFDSVSEQIKKNKKSRYDEDRWEPPRITGVEYLEHCTQMADRFNRMFLRMLRQMRDLRRYSVTVTINNPKQVNIAADGGQQVNVQEKAKAKSRKRKHLTDGSQFWEAASVIPQGSV